jgi:fatty acid desaturase
MKNPCSDSVHPALLKTAIIITLPILWFLFIMFSAVLVIGSVIMVPFMRCDHNPSNDTWNWKVF